MEHCRPGLAESRDSRLVERAGTLAAPEDQHDSDQVVHAAGRSGGAPRPAAGARELAGMAAAREWYLGGSRPSIGNGRKTRRAYGAASGSRRPRYGVGLVKERSQEPPESPRRAPSDGDVAAGMSTTCGRRRARIRRHAAEAVAARPSAGMSEGWRRRGRRRPETCRARSPRPEPAAPRRPLGRCRRTSRAPRCRNASAIASAGSTCPAVPPAAITQRSSCSATPFAAMLRRMPTDASCTTRFEAAVGDEQGGMPVSGAHPEYGGEVDRGLPAPRAQ